MSVKNPPAIVFSDFDGTITLQDSNDYLTDNLGMGGTRRKNIGQDILDGKTSFRDGFREELNSVTTPFDECIEILLANIKLDPGFIKFFEYCQAEGIPIVVVSSGMTPIISALLAKLVGPDAASKIQILSNDVRLSDNGKNWEILFKHPDSPFGHDKAQSIKEYLTNHGYADLKEDSEGLVVPQLFYAGDGVSDLSAAKETDLLFAKHGNDLITYCKRENIPYTEFNSFDDILSKLQKIVGGEPIKTFVENP
ncbi:MtnX-like HAD-IB family phosphatase [Acetobacter pasteurianus]|uniref:Phosphoserine phosphatase n=1 Tax=Lodderomyces elongisporus (strain ATCC 11503 / CBS 2605 / JCM 1781 / NBRC 1676 / NRRL YB-4239) TaxID=379508 RepID=A5DYL4_LODEL|nr:uncharacterized protein PVL30_003293 [Lodderomyces elongisporus]EDK44272.1 hypothetical protein LELG_02451 [Lodderomyces elongisporus NRRL YB-4239]MDC6271116.1 MtnX-like HAD-IB family phosphatase [Acetobacter pasteurianus]WLF79538.1 hypothetical protein PVL30_003293 [Lodderomyces elongisporus]